MTPEEREREDLLEQARAYMHERGVAALSVAALAQYLERPVSELRQFFDGDGDLVLALVAQNRVRLREAYMQLLGDGTLDDREFRRKMWHLYLDSADDQTLFFEAYGLAIHDTFYGPFLHGITDWLQLIADSMVERGTARANASAFATLTLAVYRGAMLDYLVTRDRARLNAAMELWLDLADRVQDRVKAP